MYSYIPIVTMFITSHNPFQAPLALGISYCQKDIADCATSACPSFVPSSFGLFQPRPVNSPCPSRPFIPLMMLPDRYQPSNYIRKQKTLYMYTSVPSLNHLVVERVKRKRITTIDNVKA